MSTEEALVPTVSSEEAGTEPTVEIPVDAVDPVKQAIVADGVDNEAACLNCGKEACMAEEGEPDNRFCSVECQQIYRNPISSCHALDIVHTVHTLETTRAKVTNHLMLCVITETVGNTQRDRTLTHIIRVESGNVVAQIFDRNGEVGVKYYLAQKGTNMLVIPRGIQYSLVVYEKGSIARVSITRTS